MPLTDKEIRAAQRAPKPYRLMDGRGLYLLVSDTGAKLWRYRYQFGGKEQLLALGRYPDVPLADARVERDKARQLLVKGRNPSLERRLSRLASAAAAGNTFEAIARAWHDRQRKRWTARHSDDVLSSLETMVFPSLGRIPVAEITSPMVLTVVRGIEARGAVETAHRVRQRISAAFVYGIGTGACTTDPAAVVKSALTPVERKLRPALLSLDGARNVLARAEAVPGSPITRLAHRLVALTVLRPEEAVGGSYAEFEGLDGDAPLWRVPAARMKMKAEHAVPLTPAAVDVVRAIHQLTGDLGGLLFPNVRDPNRPMVGDTLNKMLDRAGFAGQHTAASWRASFSTIMNERHPDEAGRALIDLMLAHAPKDKVQARYNRAAFLPRRRALAQEWGDLLLEGQVSAADLLLGPQK